jgi:hypothetical protein
VESRAMGDEARLCRRFISRPTTGLVVSGLVEWLWAVTCPVSEAGLCERRSEDGVGDDVAWAGASLLRGVP